MRMSLLQFLEKNNLLEDFKEVCDEETTSKEVLQWLNRRPGFTECVGRITDNRVSALRRELGIPHAAHGGKRKIKKYSRKIDVRSFEKKYRKTGVSVPGRSFHAAKISLDSYDR